MGSVDIFPNADLGGYPLLTTVVGAANRFTALSDALDTTYVKQETASAVDGIDIMGFPTPTIPGGAVVTGAELHMRGAHFFPNDTFSYAVQAKPKAQYISPYGPDPYAIVQTALGTDVGTWFFASAYDLSISNLTAQYNSSFQYNNGFYAWDQLNWNQVDLTTIRMLIGWHTPATGAGTNRVHQVFLRIFYDSPPTVSGVAPADLSAGQTFTTTPTITWTYADTEGNVQTQFRVIVVQDTTSDLLGTASGAAGFNPELATSKAFDSGVVPGAANRSTVNPFGLTNLSNYYAYVKVWQASNQGVELASAWTASAIFQVNGTPPSAAVFMGATADDTNERNVLEVRQGSWTATPYPTYIDVVKIVNVTTGGTEYVRGGVNKSKMDLMRTGSDAGNDITTPDVAALRITGDKQISVCIAKEGTVPAGGFYLFSKGDATLGTMYQFRVNSSNQMVFEWWNGTSLQTATSGTIPWPADKTPIWLRVNHATASTWHADFYYSLDPSSTAPSIVNYTNLSNFVGSGSGVTTSLNSLVNINRTTNTALFRLYYAEIRNGIGGPVVANPDFRNAQIGATTITDTTGKVWTINRALTNQNFAMFTLYDYEELPGIFRFYFAKAVTVAAGSAVAAANGVGAASGLTVQTPYIWWFKVPTKPTLNRTFQILPGSWDAHRPANAAAFTPLGRPYKVVVSDGVSGNEVDLKVEIFSQTDYDALRLIYEAQQAVFVHTTTLSRYLAFIDWNDDRYTLAQGYAVVTLKGVEVDRPAIT